MGRRYTQKEELLLRKIYATSTKEELENAFKGRTNKQLTQKARKMGLKKDKSVFSHTMFKKGQSPWNKGLKGMPCMSPHTTFKKGNKPQNTREVGETSLRVNHGKEYIFEKVADSKWIPQQILRWEKAKGTIPKGSFLVCLSDDRTNTHPNNWRLVNKRDNAHLNRNTEKALRTKAEYNDEYVAKWLSHVFKMDQDTIKDNPQLIELYRNILKLKKRTRELKKKKNGTQHT